MPAENDEFPWMSHYGKYDFFEQRMDDHSKVVSIDKQNAYQYSITLINGRSLSVCIFECYSFGVAEYMEVTQNCGKVDAIVINGSWCGYTLDVKYHCAKKGVGLFDITGFMAALNRTDLHRYLNKDELAYFKKMGWRV